MCTTEIVVSHLWELGFSDSMHWEWRYGSEHMNYCGLVLCRSSVNDCVTIRACLFLRNISDVRSGFVSYFPNRQPAEAAPDEFIHRSRDRGFIYEVSVFHSHSKPSSMTEVRHSVTHTFVQFTSFLK